MNCFIHPSRRGRALIMLLFLATVLVGVPGRAQAAQATDGGLPLLPVTIAHFGPVMSGGQILQALNVNGDWAAYVQATQGCGHCRPSNDVIYLTNLVDHRSFTIRASRLPYGLGDSTLAATGIFFATPYLVWSQPITKAANLPPDAVFTPGDYDCSLCYFDVRSGQAGPVADIQAVENLYEGPATTIALDPVGRMLVRVDGSRSSFLYTASVNEPKSVFLQLPNVLAVGQPYSGAVGAGFAAWTVLNSDNKTQLYLYRESDRSVLNTLTVDHALPLYSNGANLFWLDNTMLNRENLETREIDALPLATTPSALFVWGDRVAWQEYRPGAASLLHVVQFDTRASLLDRELKPQATSNGDRVDANLVGFGDDKLIWLANEYSSGGGPPSEQRVEVAWLVPPDPAFATVWGKADAAVAGGQVSRSWLWGPQPHYGGYEAYAEGQNGRHLVYYYDKSRMEINNPQGNPDDTYYVTNGLLVVEMMRGAIQTGDNSSAPTYTPATAAVAGDPRKDNPLTPDYATFAKVASLHGENKASDRTGQQVDDSLDVQGTVGKDATHGSLDKYARFMPQTAHNIPQLFNAYLDGMQATYGYDWTFVLGYPITEAYWTLMRVGGKDYPVLIQAYQRRVLTYTPDFQPPWQIEQGNVGQHYLQWRYNNTVK